jgi:hypothetical protein
MAQNIINANKVIINYGHSGKNSAEKIEKTEDSLDSATAQGIMGPTDKFVVTMDEAYNGLDEEVMYVSRRADSMPHTTLNRVS